MKLSTKQLQEIATLFNTTVATLYNNIEDRPITDDSIHDYKISKLLFAESEYKRISDAAINVESYLWEEQK